MTGQDIINTVRRQILETTGSFWSDAEFISLINDAEREFNSDVRVLEAKGFLSGRMGVQDYSLPPNCLSVKAILYYDNSAATSGIWRRLFPTSIEKVVEEIPDFASTDTNKFSIPRRYWIFDRRLYIYPKPKDTGSSDIMMFYKSKPVPLALATEQLNTDDSLAHGVREYVLWKAWEKEKEFELAAQAETRYKRVVAEGRRYVKKQSGDLKSRMDIESGNPISGGNNVWFNPLS